MKTEFINNFNKAYVNLYELHPNEPEIFHFRYLNQNWFFKNHLNLVLKNIKKLHKQYFPDSNLEAALFGGLFHDSGLVYKRESASPQGHEGRSTEYTRLKLHEFGYDEDFINLVCECIKATESDHETDLAEAILVRNADAYSHFTSIHFFAKSNFTKEIEDFIPWLEKKIQSTYKKLSIIDLHEEIKPLYEKYLQMIDIYKISQSEDLLVELFSHETQK